MKSWSVLILESLGLKNELVCQMVAVEGLRGYGAYQILINTIRHQQNFRARLSSLSTIAKMTKTSVRYLLKIIRNYGLFVIDKDEFYSLEISAELYQMKIKRYANRKKTVQSNSDQTKNVTTVNELNSVKSKVSKTGNKQNDCDLQPFRACAYIYNYSQLKKRER